MGLIQMQALISTQKSIEHGIHHTSESRQEKNGMWCPNICANLIPPMPELYIKVESISVFLDITKVANFCWQNADTSRT